MSLEKFSTSNITNSLSRAIGDRLLSKNYLLYWHQIDSVQTSALWYNAFQAQQANYLADSTFAAALASAKGVVSLRSDVSAVPRFVVRHTVDGTVPTQEGVPIPAVSVEVGAMFPTANYELGTGLHWRHRPLMIIALARNTYEQGLFADTLANLFDENTHFDVYDNDANATTVIGSVRIAQVTTRRETALDESEAMTHQVLVNAFLEYVA